MSDKSKVPLKKHQIILEKRASSSEKQDVPAEISTGAIQKRKNHFKAVKPNSLKNSSEIEGTSRDILFYYIFCRVAISFFFSLYAYTYHT